MFQVKQEIRGCGRVLITNHKVNTIYPDEMFAFVEGADKILWQAFIPSEPVFDENYQSSPEREAIEYIERLTYHAII